LRHDVSQLSSRLEDQHKHTQYLKESNSDLADKMADLSMQVRIECSSY
jgi:cell division protein FtsB